MIPMYILFALALVLFVSWQHDNAIIRERAEIITKNFSANAAKVQKLNEWVYHDHGFSKNQHYFIFSILGPTPVQIMETGGDCADKSRLLAAMLDELNIRAGLVMIASCAYCQFIHTVVEARLDRWHRMVVDPTWDVDYLGPNGDYLGVRELAGTNLGRERMSQLQRERGATDNIAAMPATQATFDYAVAINWNKNAVTTAIAATIKLLGYSPKTMFRPRLLEDPKLLLSLSCLFTGTVMFIGRFILGLAQGPQLRSSRV